ncbi:hypothetical protein [Acetonema longum]|uniref:Outer membrane protein beta-barrel domain-containing protein n=1 Tax=Acetonema longum DSM 6540 TaxID=1009370 RepID=F7NE76_9FIRM|nr:hypothetical protein [Acetonema longum]EGO65588.1 hypothetical protein ALO_01694 [Acetonema longum DSM 6540]
MRRLVCLTAILIAAMSSVGMCAVPDTNAGLWNIEVGYNYYSLDKTSNGHSQGNCDFNEIYGSAGIGLGLGAFINYAEGDDTAYTDYGLKTNLLLPSVAVMVGQRRMDPDNAASDNDLFCGIAVNQDLAGGFAVYGTYQKGNDFKDESLGVTYAINDNARLNFNWKNYDDNNGATYKGFGGGIFFNF